MMKLGEKKFKVLQEDGSVKEQTVTYGLNSVGRRFTFVLESDCEISHSLGVYGMLDAILHSYLKDKMDAFEDPGQAIAFRLLIKTVSVTFLGFLERLGEFHDCADPNCPWPKRPETQNPENN